MTYTSHYVTSRKPLKDVTLSKLIIRFFRSNMFIVTTTNTILVELTSIKFTVLYFSFTISYKHLPLLKYKIQLL